MIDVDQAIGQVANLYKAVTGKEIPSGSETYAPIPPEKDPVAHVQEQMDRLLDMLSRPTAPATRPAPWAPPVSIWDSPNEIVVNMDIPGVAREHMEVTIQGTLLVVNGQRQPTSVNGHRLQTSERPMGPFRRVIPLPSGVRAQEMGATLRDGVLEVRIPRDSSTVTRTVPVS